MALVAVATALAMVATPDASAAQWTTPAPQGSGCAVYDVSPIIDQIDANHDGRMTHAEWTAAGAPESSYQMMDPKHRGYVTPTEFAAVAPPPGIDIKHDCKLTVWDMNEMGRRMGKPPAGPAPRP